MNIVDVDGAAKKGVSGAMGLRGERSPCAIDVGDVVDLSCSTDLEEFRSVMICKTREVPSEDGRHLACTGTISLSEMTWLGLLAKCCNCIPLHFPSVLMIYNHSVHTLLLSF